MLLSVAQNINIAETSRLSGIFEVARRRIVRLIVNWGQVGIHEMRKFPIGWGL